AAVGAFPPGRITPTDPPSNHGPRADCYSRKRFFQLSALSGPSIRGGKDGALRACSSRIPNFMRRLGSDIGLVCVFANDTKPVGPLPVIFQHLTLASVLLIRRALGGRYNSVGIRAASSPGPALSRTASGPDIPSGSCRSAARQMDGRAAYKQRSLFL